MANDWNLFELFIVRFMVSRKPKPNPELVAQQVAQQLPPPPKREKSVGVRKVEKTEPPNDETDATSQDSHRSDTANDHAAAEHKRRSTFSY